MLSAKHWETESVTTHTRRLLICECGYQGDLKLSENDQPYSSLWEEYSLEGFNGGSLTITSYADMPKDLLAALNPYQVGRGIAAAMAFFRKALASCAPRWPRKIALDGHKPSHLGLRRLRREDHRWKYVLVRRSQHLTNTVEPH